MAPAGLTAPAGYLWGLASVAAAQRRGRPVTPRAAPPRLRCGAERR
jgi:hypothetical protein